MEEVTIPVEEYEDLLESQKKAETYGRSASEAQALNHEMKFRDDVTYFNTLIHSDKKVAERIVEKYGSKYWVSTVEDMQKYVKQQEFESMKEQETVAKSDERYSELLAKTGLDESSEVAIKLKEEFNDLMEWKKKTPDNVAKYFNKALKEVKGVSDYQRARSAIGATPWFWTGESKPTRLLEWGNWWPKWWYK
jgi:hypothetical protein